MGKIELKLVTLELKINVQSDDAANEKLEKQSIVLPISIDNVHSNNIEHKEKAIWCELMMSNNECKINCWWFFGPTIILHFGTEWKYSNAVCTLLFMPCERDRCIMSDLLKHSVLIYLVFIVEMKKI